MSFNARAYKNLPGGANECLRDQAQRLDIKMTSNRTRRVAKEIADIQADKLSKILAEPAGNGDDIMHLKGSFGGPPGTPYEGGSYKVDIRIPSDYPFRPPIMKFETKVWHPNVSSQTVSRSFHSM